VLLEDKGKLKDLLKTENQGKKGKWGDCGKSVKRVEDGKKREQTRRDVGEQGSSKNTIEKKYHSGGRGGGGEKEELWLGGGGGWGGWGGGGWGGVGWGGGGGGGGGGGSPCSIDRGKEGGESAAFIL